MPHAAIEPLLPGTSPTPPQLVLVRHLFSCVWWWCVDSKIIRNKFVYKIVLV